MGQRTCRRGAAMCVLAPQYVRFWPRNARLKITQLFSAAKMGSPGGVPNSPVYEITYLKWTASDAVSRRRAVCPLASCDPKKNSEEDQLPRAMEGRAMTLYRFSRFVGELNYCRWLTMEIVILLLAASMVHCAESAPQLTFDAPFAVSCRRIAPTDAAKLHPTQELIEVKIPITARLLSGSEKNIKECVYTLADPDEPGTIAFLDWLPRMELKTEFAKPIQHNEERTAKIGINMSAHYVVTATGDAMRQLKSGVAYELLPPQEIVLASGTIRQGHGVYFKLKPSTQTTLEGMKLFSTICAVPHGWRGGCLKLQCEAVGFDHGMFSVFNREVQSGLEVYCLALYVEGDREGERLADHVAVCQQQLFESLTDVAGVGTAKASRAASWRERIVGAPRSLNGATWLGGAFTSATQAELLNCVLDRTATVKTRDDLPRQVVLKMRDLEEAVDALRFCSAAKNLDGGLAASTTLSGVRLGPIEDWFTEPSQPQSKPGPAEASTVPKAQIKGDPVSVQVASAKEFASAKFDTNRQPMPQLGTIGTPQGNESVHKETEGKQAVAPPVDKQAVPDSVVAKRIWYFVASMWGAAFAYILAPLVVDALRHHLKVRRLRRSKVAEPTSPSTEAGRFIFAVPAIGSWISDGSSAHERLRRLHDKFPEYED